MSKTIVRENWGELFTFYNQKGQSKYSYQRIQSEMSLDKRQSLTTNKQVVNIKNLKHINSIRCRNIINNTLSLKTISQTTNTNQNIKTKQNQLRKNHMSYRNIFVQKKQKTENTSINSLAECILYSNKNKSLRRNSCKQLYILAQKKGVSKQNKITSNQSKYVNQTFCQASLHQEQTKIGSKTLNCNDKLLRLMIINPKNSVTQSSIPQNQTKRINLKTKAPRIHKVKQTSQKKLFPDLKDKDLTRKQNLLANISILLNLRRIGQSPTRRLDQITVQRQSSLIYNQKNAIYNSLSKSFLFQPQKQAMSSSQRFKSMSLHKV